MIKKNALKFSLLTIFVPIAMASLMYVVFEAGRGFTAEPSDALPLYEYLIERHAGNIETRLERLESGEEPVKMDYLWVAVGVLVACYFSGALVACAMAEKEPYVEG